MARANVDQAKALSIAHRLAGPRVRRASDLMLQGARHMAPNGDHMSGSGVRKPGQTLRQSLTVETRSGLHDIVERIGSTKNYAASVHQGSSPHYIHSNGRLLKFSWERGNLLLSARSRGRIRGNGPSSRLHRSGNYFYFLRVHHPGNKRPVRYLTTPLNLYGRSLGFRVTSTPASRSRLP